MRVPLLNLGQRLLSVRNGKSRKASHSRPREELAFYTLRHQSFRRKSPCPQDRKGMASSSIRYSRKDGRLHRNHESDMKGS